MSLVRKLGYFWYFNLTCHFAWDVFGKVDSGTFGVESFRTFDWSKVSKGWNFGLRFWRLSFNRRTDTNTQDDILQMVVYDSAHGAQLVTSVPKLWPRCILVCVFTMIFMNVSTFRKVRVKRIETHLNDPLVIYHSHGKWPIYRWFSH